MPIRAGLLTLKMTPSFIRAHGTGLPVCARTLGRLSNHPTRPRRASRGNGAAAANQPRRVMKTIAFVSWQIVDDDDLRAKRPQDQRELSGMGCEKFVSAHIRKRPLSPRL